MGRTRPRSFFDNYVRVLWRHVPRHERAVLLWRLFRDHVVVGSGLCPAAMTVMSWRMLCAVARVLSEGAGEAVPGPPAEREACLPVGRSEGVGQGVD